MADHWKVDGTGRLILDGTGKVATDCGEIRSVQLRKCFTNELLFNTGGGRWVGGCEGWSVFFVDYTEIVTPTEFYKGCVYGLEEECLPQSEFSFPPDEGPTGTGLGFGANCDHPVCTGEARATAPEALRSGIRLGTPVTPELIAERGRAAWTVLHTEGVGKDAAWLAAWEKSIPCGRCQVKYRELVKANPPTFPLTARWTWELHEGVNRDLGKPEFSWREYELRYGHQST